MALVASWVSDARSGESSMHRCQQYSEPAEQETSHRDAFHTFVHAALRACGANHFLAEFAISNARVRGERRAGRRKHHAAVPHARRIGRRDSHGVRGAVRHQPLPQQLGHYDLLCAAAHHKHERIRVKCDAHSFAVASLEVEVRRRELKRGREGDEDTLVHVHIERGRVQVMLLRLYRLWPHILMDVLKVISSLNDVEKRGEVVQAIGCREKGLLDIQKIRQGEGEVPCRLLHGRAKWSKDGLKSVAIAAQRKRLLTARSGDGVRGD
eukprot:scaffold311327_cov30-Tisochrysis_lutea.AAC.1